VSSIIGKFGVGFYASFMVAERVTVYSRKRGEATGHCWRSAGDGTFSLAEAEGVEFGTKVVLELRDDGKDFADVSKVCGS
jgi:HSP90 family molecular chaperone